MVGKCSSLLLLWCLLLSCSECRLRRVSFFSHAKNGFRAGTWLTVDKPSTTQLCCRWLSGSTGHSPHAQKIFTQWQITPGFFYHANLTFFSSKWPGERFGTVSSFCKCRRQPDSNQGTLGLQSNALRLSYITLASVTRQSFLSLRVYI